MGKKEKAELAARRKAYFERYGTQSQVPIPLGVSLPPGFHNLGNSCFLNSTLQSLTATPLLHALLTFTPPPDLEHDRDLYPARSPAMTNNRGPPGVRRQWEAGMPIADAFLRFEDEAINARQTGKTSLSPRELLGQIGAKYDQYLGYRQQDAHELLRHLLDGMRMEEMDIIKKRNPPPPKSKHKSKHSRPSSPERSDTLKPSAPPSSAGPDASPNPAAGPVPDDPLVPFADMVFGGALASMLVCEGCKHVSHTYEDFMDLSLSIKPEDAREKKRDKFKFFHKFRKGTAPLPRTPPPTMVPIPFPSTEMDVSSAAVSANPSTVDVHVNGVGSVEAVVPNGLTVGAGGGVKDERRASAGSAPGLVVSDGEISTAQPRARVSSVQISTEEGHDRDDSGASGVGRLGRRVSLQGWKKKDKDKDKDKSKERTKSKERAGDKSKERAGDNKTEDERDKSRPSSPVLAPVLMEPNSGSAAVSRSQSPSRKNEAAYLKKVLADVGAPPTNPLAMLKGAADGLGMLKDPFARPSMDDVWLKLSSGRGSIPDALRSFTAVEVLEGDNAFACRRCWKIAHGIPVGRARGAGSGGGVNGTKSKESVSTSESAYDSDSSGSDSDSEQSSSDQGSLVPPPPLGGIPLRPASTSGVGAGPEQWARDTVLPRPSSAPMVEDRALTSMQPIPTIEMTSPDAERARPFPASPPPMVRTATQGSTETGSSAVTGDESAHSTAATSGLGPIIAAPVPRTPIALRSTTLPAHASAALTAIPRSQQYIHRRALKRYLIATPPPVLVIHLKRFQQVAGAGAMFFGSLRKLDDFVAFPEVLDVAPFVAPNREEYGMGRAKKTAAGRANDKVTAHGPGLGWFGRGREKEKAVKYRLYAVVVHIGSMLGGHYIAYIALPPIPPLTPEGEEAPAAPEDPTGTKPGDAKEPDGKNKEKRQWVYISDTTVRPVSFEEVSKAKAYLCFYERFYD
ncbi:hypothetical protein FRC12_010477 [Ceratobasidium sp. 428]|nr:hypothetical protein FRC12_010477 [Ceratobasidium sp. 428]